MAEPAQAIRLLLVEDSENDANLLLRRVRQAGFDPQVLRVDDPDNLRRALEQPWDIVICDYQMPTMDAPRAISIIRATALDLPIIVVSGAVGEESAVAVMRAGAQDYLMKDRLFRLGEVIRRELAEVTVRRKQAEAEEAFLASEDRLRFAMEAAQLGVWEWDIPNDVMDWAFPTGSWRLLVNGAQRGTFAECQLAVFTDDRDVMARAFLDAVQGRRRTLAIEYRVLAEDTSVHWLDVRGRVSFDAAGKAVRMAGTFLDITQRRALEEQLAHSDKMKTIGQLAGGVAHDFNNLLTVILTYCQLLDGIDPTEEDVNELTAPVREAAERAAALTRQLLVFSRPEATNPQVIDLNEVITATTNLLRRLVGEHVRIETQLTSGIWRVRMDRTQCEQVIVNLAVNARDAMPQGGTVRIATRNVPAGAPGQTIASEKDHLILEMSDTGQGMTEEVQRKAFQPFFTTKSLGRGTGLGLATCQTAVANAGGVIHLESVVGQGTTFRILLPRSEDDVVPALPKSRGVRSGTAAEAILVVEDDALVRETATRALRAAGYTAVATANGQEALTLLFAQPGRFNLVFTDLAMPVMGGVALAEIMRIRLPGLPILFASGYPPETTDGLGATPGGTFLAKPYTADELTQSVRALLDERGSPKPTR